MRVLLLQALGLGDLLTAIPAVRAVRKEFGEAELIWAGNAEYASLIESEVDQIFPVQGLDNWVQLPAAELGINLHGKGPRSHELLAYTHRQIAFFHPTLAVEGPTWPDHVHMRQLWIDLLASYGIAGDSSDLYLDSGDESSEHIVLHLGAKDRDRWWPMERFAEVARALPDVVATAGPSERERADGLGVEVFQGSFQQLTSLVRSARLVISVDSGISHLAYAYQRPSVTLFGPAPAARWGPPMDPRHTILGNTDTTEVIRPTGPCSPHLLAISSEQVISAARDLLHLG